jgi:hypothetical protein
MLSPTPRFPTGEIQAENYKARSVILSQNKITQPHRQNTNQTGGRRHEAQSTERILMVKRSNHSFNPEANEGGTGFTPAYLLSARRHAGALVAGSLFIPLHL